MPDSEQPPLNFFKALRDLRDANGRPIVKSINVRIPLAKPLQQMIDDEHDGCPNDDDDDASPNP